MTTGIELLEGVYEQLRAAGVVRSKAEFSETLLGKSQSYLTSMRAKQRTVPDAVIMELGDNLMTEIAELDPTHDETRALLRRAVARVNTYLADQTIPVAIAQPTSTAGQKVARMPKGLFGWFRALAGAAIV